MAQNKLPLINSAHGSETRNIINELIKLFNGMSYTYNESLQKAQDILDEAQQTNDMNESVQQQINTLIAESGTSDSEVLQARIDAEGNEYPLLKDRLDESDEQLAHKATQKFHNNSGNDNNPNITHGSVKNAIASDIQSGTIAGGGGDGQENVIGGNPDNVGQGISNLPTVTDTNAHFTAILGGYDNVNNGLASFIAGQHCYIRQTADHGGIFGGSYHKIEQGGYNAIVGGTNNQIKGASSNSLATGYGVTIDNSQNSFAMGTNSTIKDSFNASLFGTGSVEDSNGATSTGRSQSVIGSGDAFVSGNGHQFNGAPYSGAFAGYQNKAKGQYSALLAGRENELNSNYSTIWGRGGKSYVGGSFVGASNKFAVVGDAQGSIIPLKTSATSATPKLLFNVDGGLVLLQDGALVSIRGHFVAKRTDVIGEFADFRIEALVYCDATTHDTQVIGTPEIIKKFSSTGAENWNMSLANYTDNRLNLRVVGEDAKTIQFFGWLELIETI